MHNSMIHSRYSEAVRLSVIAILVMILCFSFGKYMEYFVALSYGSFRFAALFCGIGNQKEFKRKLAPAHPLKW